MMTVRESRPVWPLVLLFSALAAVVLVLWPVAPALRFVVVGWFLLVCPGMAIVRLAHLTEPWLRWLLAVMLSLALDAAVAMALLYAGLWSIEGILMVLAVVTLVGALMQTIELWRVPSDGSRLVK